MPWLADLVESSEGSFNVLPVQCLCEFLLNSTTAASEENASEESQKLKKRKQKQLLVHLQNLLQHPMSEEQQRSSIETLDYFMRRLGSQQTHQRLQVNTIFLQCIRFWEGEGVILWTDKSHLSTILGVFLPFFLISPNVYHEDFLKKAKNILHFGRP